MSEEKKKATGSVAHKLEEGICGGGTPGRGCGKRILWGRTPGGKRIPLDPSAPVYSALAGDSWVTRSTSSFVSHFATCPKANEFSGGKKP